MTDNREMSDLACRAFGAGFAAISHLDAPGIVAELQRQRDRYDPLQLVVAMARRCSDPRNTTPRLQAFDFEGHVACRRHPGASVRTDGLCSVCRNDALADDSGTIRDRGGRPIPAEARELITARLGCSGRAVS